MDEHRRGLQQHTHPGTFVVHRYTNNDHMSNTSTSLYIFIAGVAVGAALGVLLAPAPGKETRAKLMKKGGQLRDKVGEMVDEAKAMAHEAADNVEGAVRSAASQAQTSAGSSGSYRGTSSGTGRV